MKQNRSMPWDIILCFGVSIIFYPLFLYDNSYFRILFGIPFLFLIPGYLFLLCLFPSSRIDKKISIFERMVLSIVFSLAIISIIGIGLNFTSLSISLFWFCTILIGFVIIFSIISLIRWYQQQPSERNYINFPIKFPTSHKPFDSILNIILFLVTLTTFIAILILIISSFMTISERGETFTEFYILGEQQHANYYLKNITLGENNSITLGITNYEQKGMQYTVEVWLINQTMELKQVQNNTDIAYYEMFFIDKIEVSLPAYELKIEELSDSQWLHPIYFSIINRSGMYKLQFLLYTNTTELYDRNTNYYKIAQTKIKQAYRTVHIWINIIDE